MKTREQKLLEQNHELEKIADQLEQKHFRNSITLRVHGIGWHVLMVLIL